MQTNARLVIVGAGIVGVSAAYHLVKKGWRDIVVLDQSELYYTGGSTSHAPGLVFQTNGSKLMCEFAQYTVGLLSELHQQAAPDKPIWYDVGGVEVAYTPERLAELKRKHGLATSYGLESHLISPAEVKQMIPLVDDKVIHGGYYVPSDGDTKAVHAVEMMAALASADGAVAFHGDVPVTDIEFETKNGHISAVVTPKGKISTEQVLLCTNIWSPVLAAKVGVTIPLLAVEHQYAVTEPLAELQGSKRDLEHPILRHQDHAMYFRQHLDAYGIGSYQHDPVLADPWSLGKLAMHDFTPNHFESAWNSTTELLPPLKGKALTTKFNGMFSFTIDGMPVMGEVQHLKGFWTAVGVWVTHSGGVGKAIAEWMTDGVTETDTREADVNRFHGYQLTRKYIWARCHTQYDEVYDIIHPRQQMENPRQVRLTPFHSRLEALEGEFFESAGWERPQWYNANEKLLHQYKLPPRIGWEARLWSPIEGAEHLATRERVALYDLTPFTKVEVSGPGAAQFLDYIAANRVAQPVGKVVYTALLNQGGGIRADLTITRLSADRFWVLTGGGSGMLDLAWLQQHAPEDGSVQIRDITSQYGTLGLWGPKAREVLQSVCENDVSNEAFPYFTAQQLIIDTVPVLALRVSYVGELGWELYARGEYCARLWDSLWGAGQPHGIIAGGMGAFDSLRLEKGYRFWGQDIHTEYNPYEAGLGWAVRLKKGDFLGREALLGIKRAGINKKLTCLTLDDSAAVVMGKEPIISNGQKLGYVTSANYGYSIGKCIVYGYLPLEFTSAGTQVDIEYFGERLAATVTGEPLFDPTGERLRV
jgi:glycine cleavage system aminomethyltransferase T/glycine/D-amino acid oxidase-like deaminating enzyme